ncbi:MAG: hypothetical protein ACOX1P_10990 [Thermoguttaceae bacterium]|jgi:hypothetical protein
MTTPTWHRATKRSPCVVCGRAGDCVYIGPELWLKLKRDGWLCHCHRRGGADG